MGGQSTQSQTQSSQVQPWDQAQGMLKSIMGQVQTGLGNTGLTGAESGALNSVENNAAAGNPYASSIGGYASSLLNGGGANAQAGNVQGNLDTFRQQMMPFASPSYSSMNDPALRGALDQIRSDVSSQVNGQFASAGRDMSGMNQQTLARGISQGQAPLILGQYNQDRATQQGAANALYGAGNSTAGQLAGMQQTALGNQQQGVGASQDALSADNYGNNQILAAEAQRRGIPVQALSLLANLGIPMGQLGQQSTGQSSGTQQMAGAQQFGMLANGVGNILNGAGNFMKYMPSDRRLKQDIEQVGTLFDGQPVYRYRYNNSITWHIGLIAQEVEQVAPEAVCEFSGFKHVDYRAATEASRKIKEAA